MPARRYDAKPNSGGGSLRHFGGPCGLIVLPLPYKSNTEFLIELNILHLQSYTRPTTNRQPLNNMPSPVESGQEIMIPLFDPAVAGAPVHVSWQQNMAQRKADYYALTADNITTG